MNIPTARSRFLRATSLGLLISLASSLAFALNPNLPPSGNFDLSIWRLTLPVDQNGGFTPGGAYTPTTSVLNAGFEMSPYFYTGSDGAMVFSVPHNGISHVTGSNAHPRSEFREVFPDGNKHNWLPRAYTGVHTMTASCIVENVGAGGVVSIGQIHTDESAAGSGFAAIMLFFDNSVTPSRVTAKIKKTAGLYSSNQFLTFPNIAEGDVINYQLRLEGTTTSCLFTATINGVSQSFNMYASDSRYANEVFYFKAGAYYTDPVDSETAVVRFYQLDVSHGNADTSPVITTTSLPNGVVGTAYNQTLAATGGNAPLVWLLDSGSLPAGLNLGTNGVINGTPTTAGTSSFTVSVDDTDGDFDLQVFALSIAATPPAQTTAPSFSPGSGSYASTQSVTITSATSGASIRYTTDGSTPTATTGTIYSAPISIAATTTLKAIAYKSGLTDSVTSSASYTITSGSTTAPVTYELESAAIDTAYWEVIEDSNASSGYSLRTIGSGSPAASGSLTFTFNKNTSGSVYVHVRGRAPNGTSSDTCYVRVDGGSWYRLNFANTNTYSWDDKPYSGLANGTHTVEVRGGEANTVIDQVAILLTSTPPN